MWTFQQLPWKNVKNTFFAITQNIFFYVHEQYFQKIILSHFSVCLPPCPSLKSDKLMFRNLMSRIEVGGGGLTLKQQTSAVHAVLTPAPISQQRSSFHWPFLVLKKSYTHIMGEPQNFFFFFWNSTSGACIGSKRLF